MKEKFDMSYFSDLKKDMEARWTILRKKDNGWAKRFLAGAELVCFPASILTLVLLLPAQITAIRCGWVCPVWAARTMEVLISAAVGYITNYFAIEMLFKPYEVKKWLFLWPQGLVPRNKKQIGEELGTQVAEKLLKPEEIAEKLCSMVTDILHNPGVTGKFIDSIQSLLSENMDKITAAIVPQIEKSIETELKKFLSPQKIITLWQDCFAPKLAEKENREFIAREIVNSLKQRAPELTNLLKDGLREYVRDYLSEKIPFGLGADTIADGLVAFINWPEIEKKLAEKIADPSVRNMIRDELATLADRINEWMQTPAGQEKIAEWTTSLHEKFQIWLNEYLENNLPGIARRLLTSYELWNWLENTMLPAAEPKIKEFIESQKDTIVQTLDIRNRVSQAIDRQDVREFHNMINSVAAEHLGAIQVLGFVLGAVIGAFQLLI